eukprot:TRINITY_DN261_c1_g2_i1.p1 TRINITY_DN261_c1_g2~~TRINITY_DN261_c1_g2_i1.p1  ORF type:complete len:133 (+),score=71.05 TRINITY_DN261_c1_g2_i1:123-521(+)
MALTPEKLEAELKEFRATQQELQKTATSIQQYSTQLNENEMVLKELELLDDEAEVFKLIGPALVKQDSSEAKFNVRKRIDYISQELRRLETVAKDSQKKLESKRAKIMEAQIAMQKAQQAQLQTAQVAAAPK